MKTFGLRRPVDEERQLFRIHTRALGKGEAYLGKIVPFDKRKRLGRTKAGDEWRSFALNAAKMCKQRMAMDHDLLADQLHKCADMEAAVHRRLRTMS